MTTPTTDHRCRIERKNVETPGRSRQVARSVCNCGWVSDWLSSPTRAAEAGLDHSSAAGRTR